MDFRPLARIIVDGVEIPADKIEARSLMHDLDNGTLTLTLANVRVLETVYRDMEGRT